MKHLHRAHEYKPLTEATARKWLQAQGIDVDEEIKLLDVAVSVMSAMPIVKIYQRPETWRPLYAECPWCKRPMQRVVVPPLIALWLCLPCNEQNRDFWMNNGG